MQASRLSCHYTCMSASDSGCVFNVKQSVIRLFYRHRVIWNHKYRNRACSHLNSQAECVLLEIAQWLFLSPLAVSVGLLFYWYFCCGEWSVGYYSIRRSSSYFCSVWRWQRFWRRSRWFLASWGRQVNFHGACQGVVRRHTDQRP